MKYIAEFKVKKLSIDLYQYETFEKILIVTRNPKRVENLLKSPGFMYKLKMKLKEDKNILDCEFFRIEEVKKTFKW